MISRYRNLLNLTDSPNAVKDCTGVTMEHDVVDVHENDLHESYVDENDEAVPLSNVKQSLRKNLAQWVMRHKVPHNQVDDLLKVLNVSGVKNLPRSARKLMQTDITPISLTVVEPGEYYHYGMQHYLKSKNFPFLTNMDTIIIDVGIDGLQVFRSSRRVLWPIIGSFSNFATEVPFLIGCYSGFKKPSSVNDFLREFSMEVCELQRNGVQVGSNEVRKEFKVRLFTCDSPARVYITGVQYHMGKNSCPKCTQEGVYCNRKMVFSKDVALSRTDDSFKERRDLNHHSLQFQKEKSVLETSGFGMVSQFPLDSMHLVDLGVVKKMLKAMAKNRIHLYSVNTQEINAKLIQLSKIVPLEFARTVTTLEDIALWKATEYRHFLLYSGVIVLKNSVHDDVYYNFLLLHSAIRLLSCENSSRNNANVASKLLHEFVSGFAVLYGETEITFNLHCLLHLPECVLQFGALDNFSAFKYENFMQHLKRLIKKPTGILQQIHRRLQEFNSAEYIPQLSKFNTFIISSKNLRNSYCFV